MLMCVEKTKFQMKLMYFETLDGNNAIVDNVWKLYSTCQMLEH